MECFPTFKFVSLCFPKASMKMGLPPRAHNGSFGKWPKDRGKHGWGSECTGDMQMQDCLRLVDG